MATEEIQCKRAKTEELEESGVIILNRHLPAGIISDIISRLSLEDIIRCRSISTDWYRITNNLRSNHFHNTKSQLFDILLVEYRYRSSNKSLHMISSNSSRIDGKCKHVQIPFGNRLNDAVIGSCNGLLCIRGSPVAICNPITKEKMMLPEIELHPQCDERFAPTAGFGYDSINNKYKVVVVYHYCRYINECSFTLVATVDIITLGESSWRRLQFPEEESCIDTHNHVVFINGAFHWLNGRQHEYENSNEGTYQLDGILTLDISTEKFKFIKFSASVDLDTSHVQVFDIGSSLALVGEMSDYSYEDYEDSSDEYRSGRPTKISIWKIWKILGENADGGCRYQCMTLNVDLKTMGHFTGIVYLEPVGALGKDKFLFKASKHGRGSRFNRLILYDTENDKGSVLEVPAEVPQYWTATIFQPSLVPPASLGCTFTNF